MSYRMVNHEMRREIRLHIEAAARKQGFALEQHTIENLINKRVQAIGKELATGKPAEFIDWDGITRRAHEDELESHERLGHVGVQPSPSTLDD